jgi:eukaryotic-like serine/threonine-protein kinase
MTLASGTKLGQYEILGPLGAGGMGEVYRARDASLNRDVAIKVLPHLISADPDRLHRFEVEAKAAAALNHPNILSVYQFGTHEGSPYLVSELLEGKTLGESLRRGPLFFRQAIQYGAQIARGLAAAHEKGIVHRDLKPDNIFLTKDGRIKILDFGLAKVIPSKSPTALATTITRIGVAMGTVGYMSPEQVRGLATDHRTDIFALGAILCEMVMGQRTFQRATEADTVSAILNEEPPPIAQLSPDTPPALERVIRRCLEKNPEQRFHSASDLAFALEALSDPAWMGSGEHSIPAEPQRRRALTTVAAAIILVLVGSLLTYFWLQPAQVPTVNNYEQLTHDGQPKALIGTDGARLYLAIGSGSSSNFSLHDIAELSTSGGQLRKIDVTTSTNMVPLGLSPDGSQLLVIEGQGAPPKGPLTSVPILGGTPRRIGDFVAETASLSPDGKLLAYTSLGDLFLARPDGSESHKLVGVNGDIRNVTWSPDSSRLQFDSSETAGTVGLQVEREVSADGSGLHPLMEGWHNPPDECCGKWTADGKYFVFQSQGQIWTLPKSGGMFGSAPKPIALTSSPMTLSSPLPSKDGKKLLVIGRTYRGELRRYDSATHQFVPFLGGISAEYIAFSKDGKWVAYTTYPEGILWRSRIDGSERVQLTSPPISPLLPRWSPDGKTILFFQFAQGADKPARIYEVSPEGGSPRLLLPDDHSQQLDPNWSPDGTKIIFSGQSNDPSSAIRILDVASNQLSSLPGSNGLYSPRWSPDGRYVSAFSGDSKVLLLFDFQTQKWTELSQGSLGWLNWSHDGQFVYVLDFRQRSAVLRIRIRDRKNEDVVELKEFPATGRYGTALALTPDDQPLLLRDEGSQDVYSVDWQSR